MTVIGISEPMFVLVLDGQDEEISVYGLTPPVPGTEIWAEGSSHYRVSRVVLDVRDGNAFYQIFATQRSP